MKLAIVSPPLPNSGDMPLAPPILEYLYALTKQEDDSFDIELIDANRKIIEPEALDADVVAISCMTATCSWAYKFSKACSDAGKKSLLGGIHPSAMPEEAKQFADSVIIGEAESVWGDVLADLKSNNLKPFYHGKRTDLKNMPLPSKKALSGRYMFRTIFTARGCPHRCTFCSTHKFFGDQVRLRPIEDVVRDVNFYTDKIYFNGDDNIWGTDVNRTINLYKELARLRKKWWFGFGDLRTVQEEKGDELLKWASNCGLTSVWVGWESSDVDVLKKFKALGKQGKDRVEAIKKIKNYGIDVIIFMMLGGRENHLEDFQRTLELCDQLNVGVHPVLTTPLPGTELFDSYKPYIFENHGWEHFNGAEMVYAHEDPQMTPKAVEAAFHDLTVDIFSYKRIMRRITSISAKGFPVAHFLSLMQQLPMKRAFGKAKQNWLANNI